MEPPEKASLATRHSLLDRLKDWEDDQSWEVFFETYWKLIYGTATKAGLSDAEAQDVVQETVLSVAKKMHEFKYDPALGSFKGWLLKLTRWRITDQMRKRRGLPSKSASGESENSGTSTVERLPDENNLNLDEIWEANWQKNLMDAAMQRVKRKVSAKQYQLFDLYAVKQWSLREITETLGVSQDQVYKAKSRITELVKQEVEYLQTKMI